MGMPKYVRIGGRGSRRKALAKHRAERAKYPIRWHIAGKRNRYHLYTKPRLRAIQRLMKHLIIEFMRKYK